MEIINVKYTIFELVQPENLKDIEQDRYKSVAIYRTVLQKLNVYNVEEEHVNMEDAINEINNKKELLKGCDLTIIPVISISYDGKIR